MDYFELNTSLGTMAFRGNRDGIQSIQFLEEPSTTSEIIPDSLCEAVSQMKAFLAGSIKDFTFVMQPEGTDFQKKYGLSFLKFPTAQRFLISKSLKFTAIQKRYEL